MDEFGDMSPTLFPSVVRPCLTDRKGFGVFVGSVRGKNHLWKTFKAAKDDPAWYAAILPASKTELLDAAELDDARRQMTEEQYEAEFECNPNAPIVGSFYGRDINACEAEGRITNIPCEACVPVHTAWDLGHRHSTAIWFFQVVGPEVRIIDYYENSGQYADHYCGVVAARGYPQGIDYVPHDARVHEWGTGKTRLETLIALGRKPQVVTEH